MIRFAQRTTTLCAVAALSAAAIGAGTALTTPRSAHAADVAPAAASATAVAPAAGAAPAAPIAATGTPSPGALQAPVPMPGAGRPGLPPPPPRGPLAGPPPFNPWGLPPSFARLGLSVQQEDAVFEIMHKQVADMRTQARIARDAGLSLSAMADDESFDEGAARQAANTLAQAESQMRFMQVRDAQRIRALLTPQQRVLWDDDDDDDPGMPAPPPPGFGAMLSPPPPMPGCSRDPRADAALPTPGAAAVPRGAAGN